MQKVRRSQHRVNMEFGQKQEQGFSSCDLSPRHYSDTSLQWVTRPHINCWLDFMTLERKGPWGDPQAIQAVDTISSHFYLACSLHAYYMQPTCVYMSLSVCVKTQSFMFVVDVDVVQVPVTLPLNPLPNQSNIQTTSTSKVKQVACRRRMVRAGGGCQNGQG